MTDLARDPDRLAASAPMDPSPQVAGATPLIAVLIPCYNEALTIGEVVSDFARCIPSAQIHVYDNNSTDETAAVARERGARVHARRCRAREM